MQARKLWKKTCVKYLSQVIFLKECPSHDILKFIKKKKISL